MMNIPYNSIFLVCKCVVKRQMIPKGSWCRVDIDQYRSIKIEKESSKLLFFQFCFSLPSKYMTPMAIDRWRYMVKVLLRWRICFFGHRATTQAKSTKLVWFLFEILTRTFISEGWTGYQWKSFNDSVMNSPSSQSPFVSSRNAPPPPLIIIS